MTCEASRPRRLTCLSMPAEPARSQWAGKARSRITEQARSLCPVRQARQDRLAPAGGMPRDEGSAFMERNRHQVTGFVFVMVLTVVTPAAQGEQESSSESSVNQALEWNQIFVDTLIATNTANSSSQRLGAIVHTAIFDAYNGIEQRYGPIFVHDRAPNGASRRAAVIAAAYTALVGLFPSRQPALDASYAAS